MKKILLVLSVTSLLIAVGCNRDDKSSKDTSIEREETRTNPDGSVIEREESMDYETEDRLGRPVEDIQVEEVERKIED